MTVFGVLFVIVYLVCNAVIQKKIAQKKAVSKSREDIPVTAPALFNRRQHVESIVRQPVVTKPAPISLLRDGLEDKEHDWLAEQMAYERSIKPVLDDMFMLRKEHFGNCDAEMLQAEHTHNCDVKNNQATYRGSSKMSQQDMNVLKERIRQRM